MAIQEAVVPVQQILVVDVPIVVMNAVGPLRASISSTQPWASESGKCVYPRVMESADPGAHTQRCTAGPFDVLNRSSLRQSDRSVNLYQPGLQARCFYSCQAALAVSIRELLELRGVEIRHRSSDTKAQSAPLTHRMM